MSAIGAYLVASQDVLRAEAGMYRKKLLAESAFEQSQQAARRYAQASSTYETRFLVASRDESLAEERKRVGEFQDATKTMNAALTKLSEAATASQPSYRVTHLSTRRFSRKRASA